MEEFKRKATTSNPHDIQIEAGWISGWRPFLEDSANVMRKLPESEGQSADVSDEAMALGPCPNPVAHTRPVVVVVVVELARSPFLAAATIASVVRSAR